MIRNIWTIARRDLRAYFTSPIAYIVIAGFLLIMGLMFSAIVRGFAMHAMQNQQYNYGKGISIADGIIQPLFGNMIIVFLFLIPFITMRLFAEEKKLNTIQLLMTSPVTLWEMIFGKFFSSLMLVCTMLGLTLIYPIILFATANPEIGPIVGCYVGTLLLISCYLSIGVLCSAATENQIVAGALTFVGCLFFWIISWSSEMAGPVWGEVLTYLSLIGHFQKFGQGLLTVSDSFYYLSFIGIGLFLTHRVLDSFRWR